MAESRYALMNTAQSGISALGTASLADGSTAPDSLSKSLLDLNLALSLASVDIRLLTQEQVKLREVLAAQQSLFKAGGGAPAASEPKSKLKAEVDQRPPPKSLHSAMANETALVELNQVLGLSNDRLQALSEENQQTASDKRVAPSGATNVDLAQVQLSAARAGIGDGIKGDWRATELSGFSRDAGIAASAFKLDIKAAGELLAGLRSSLKLDRYQSQDLADATTYLGNSGMDAKAADIGAVVLRSGASAVEAGMQPEQVAALAAALLNSGADKEGASATLKSLASVLAKGSAASPDQRSALTRLELDPELLADRMHKDAPAAINTVLQALNKQPVQERAALTKTLFGENDARILELLKKPDDVTTAFSRVSDKQKYATSELGTDAGAAAKTAEAYGNTSQGRWNALDASLNRLSTAVGNALAPITDAIAVSLTAVVNGLSAAAEALPSLAAGLTLAGMAAIPFVGGALKSGVSSVLDVVNKKLLRLATTRLPPDISDLIVGDDDDGGGGRRKRFPRSSNRRNPSRATIGTRPPRPASGGRLGTIAARVAPMFDNVKIGLKLWADKAASGASSLFKLPGATLTSMSDKVGTWAGKVANGPPSLLKGPVTRLMPIADKVGVLGGKAVSGASSLMSGATARVMPMVENLGARIMPTVAKALPVLKVGAPLAIAHAAYAGLKGWREGDDKAVKGAAGELAGSAIGATIGTFIAPGIGTFIGGTLGGYLGSYLGEKLASPPEDKLAPPGQVAKDLASAQTQTQNQTVSFSPLVQVTCPAPDTAQQIQSIIEQQLSGQFHGQFMPLLTANPLNTRRDAALTDGAGA